MFDWNDEEITNIIWGEARESDDHIVPYPDANEEKHSNSFGDQTKKGWDEEAHSIKPDGADFREPELKGNPKYEEDECLEDGLGLESRPSASISNSTKTEQDSTRMGASSNLTEIPECNASKRGETSRLHVSSEIFQNQQDDEQGNFVNYGWDNIGNFDDLEKIFSNDDPIFGDASLGNVDELWSSSKDVTRSPDKSIPLSFEAPSLDVNALPTLSGQLAIPSEFSLDQDILSPVSPEITNSTSDTPKLKSCRNADEYAEGENKSLKIDNTTKDASRNSPALNSPLSHGTPDIQNEFVDRGIQQNQLRRTGIRSKEKYEVRPLQYICATWSTSPNQLQQFDSQYAPAMGQPYPPFVASQHGQLGPHSSQYNHFRGPFFGSPLYVNVGTHCLPMVGLPQHHSGEDGHQNTISDFGTSLVNPDALRKPSGLS
ncbi:hypothetical protein Leryth_008140 [Lithospermum erythrorhizon]|nr:hypothetical protein Leryth_008140 [Lithospermum erythrorhizon]